RHRHWFQLVASARFPDGDVFSGHPIHLSDTAGHWWGAGASMAQDTVEVLTRRAGFSADEIDALLARGVAFTEACPEQTLRRPYIDYAEILGVHRTEAGWPGRGAACAWSSGPGSPVRTRRGSGPRSAPRSSWSSRPR